MASTRSWAFCFLLFLTVAARAQDTDSPQNAAAVMGERLFLETRFAQYFFTNSGGDANATLASGDPVMNVTQTSNAPVAGPFAGQSMNCRACHLVDEFNSSLGNRTYCDFTTRSPIPLRGDGRTNTPRNSPTLVDSLLPRATPMFLHLDGQFATPYDLIVATLTGRNYGWQPTESSTAIAHIAHIIRDDDGSGALAQGKFGGGYSYAEVISPNSSFPVTKDYRLNIQFTLGDITITDTNDPGYVTDEEIVDDAAALIQAYLETLVFAQDLDGNFIGSPFDVFLMKNGLPQQPAVGETPLQYSQRLLADIHALASPQFVTDPDDGHFTTQNQLFQFGPQELQGLEIFFARGRPGQPGSGQTGNCVVCHTPPAFTDFLFHNNGAGQEEYDGIHGAGSFESLFVPGLATRQSNYNAYLPQTTTHPSALGPFITPPASSNAALADLGLWNVFANPDFPGPQPGLQQILPGLIAVLPPGIAGVTKTGQQFAFSVTHALPGWTYQVLTSTDASLPLVDWSAVATNTVEAGGGFNFTNVTAGGASQFFVVTGVPSAEVALPYTIALFKTPTVRDLGQSAPYLHTGRMATIEEVLEFYQTFSQKAAAGMVRNPDLNIQAISLDDSAIAPLAAFLRALNEDYTD